MGSFVHRFGGSRTGVWIIKHLTAPLDRLLYRLTGGRLVSTGRPVGPTLLLTTIGRRSGRPRTNPVFYLEDAGRLLICNVIPPFERPNPWTLNLRANPGVIAQIGGRTDRRIAREATDEEVARYWPRFVEIWPAYARFYEQGGRRSIFVLEPERRTSGVA